MKPKKQLRQLYCPSHELWHYVNDRVDDEVAIAHQTFYTYYELFRDIVKDYLNFALTE